MKLVYAGALSTLLVVSIGVVMIIPIFIPSTRTDDSFKVALVFVAGHDATPSWCQKLSSYLTSEDVRATIFFAGKFATTNPECVAGFSSEVDVGSQTFNDANLTAIPDYEIQLLEVMDGKAAVDKAGNLDSKLFKAPYGATDENIYSLLSRSNILVDFSYSDHYNEYSEGQFIRMEIPIYDFSQYQPSYFLDLAKGDGPREILLFIDFLTPYEKITDLVQSLKSVNCRLVNASDLVGVELTLRKK